ncbi:MAG: thiosulfohydrolase SoxB [Chromatiales bacterium]|nr:thiosulfohydrolase SoxB [Chromatiales bacterium]
MNLTRRQFIALMSTAAAAGLLPRGASFAAAGDFYDFPFSGNVRLLHFTDCHAQLLPIYFREPNANIGIGEASGRVPHLVGEHLLKRYPNLSEPYIHALTYLNFTEDARRFGKVGGFAHLSTLVKQLRAAAGENRTLLLDGGDTWQGSGTAYWTRGKDMVGACNLLGVDVMTGHWEFTYNDDEILQQLKEVNGDFVAHNVRLTEEGLFDGKPAYDEASGHVFPPYVIKDMAGVRVAVIGQAYPYTPISNPRRFIPHWTFGIREAELQELVTEIREREKPSVVVLLSHNGADIDLKLASRVEGIDVILGGHTHDGVVEAVEVANRSGRTLVSNGGSNGKFLGVMDLHVKNNKVADYHYRLLPVFANLLPADKEMQAYIDQVRAPYAEKLGEQLAVADDLLYRRGNFNGTFDQLICEALAERLDTQIALSPGFRWGTTVLPGQAVSMEHVLDQTCMTYPETYATEMTGQQLKLIFEDVCDNLFNTDPYLQQGGDMVRVTGMNYVCDPTASMGNRISDMQLDNGKAIEADKSYRVSGWATVGSQSPGAPVWDVVADYLRDKKIASVNKLNTPKLVNMAHNLGWST